jgi:hypothetical protein
MYRGDEGVLDLAILGEETAELVQIRAPRDVADVPAKAAMHTASSPQQTDPRMRDHSSLKRSVADPTNLLMVEAACTSSTTCLYTKSARCSATAAASVAVPDHPDLDVVTLLL